MDEFYSFLILLRIYLAGLSFSFFCFQRQEKKMAVLMGALLYAFSFWTIFAAVRHPYFMNPMIYFPLVLAGADRIFRKKRPFSLYFFAGSGSDEQLLFWLYDLPSGDALLHLPLQSCFRDVSSETAGGMGWKVSGIFGDCPAAVVCDSASGGSLCASVRKDFHRSLDFAPVSAVLL